VKLVVVNCWDDKSVAWTHRVISPGIYNVSRFAVIWLFGQFRWSSCNKLAIFSDSSDNHLLGALLEPSPFSRGEGGGVKHTFLGGLGGRRYGPYLQSMLKLVP
jgi:hypothetical protein